MFSVDAAILDHCRMFLKWWNFYEKFFSQAEKDRMCAILGYHLCFFVSRDFEHFRPEDEFKRRELMHFFFDIFNQLPACHDCYLAEMELVDGRMRVKFQPLMTLKWTPWIYFNPMPEGERQALFDQLMEQAA